MRREQRKDDNDELNRVAPSCSQHQRNNTGDYDDEHHTTLDHLQTDDTTTTHWVTLSFRNTKVLHQTLNPTAELWCKTLSWIMFGVKPRF